MRPYDLYIKHASATSRGLALLRSMRAAHGELPLFHSASHEAVQSIVEHGLQPSISLARHGITPQTVEGGPSFGRTLPRKNYDPAFVDRMHSMNAMLSHMTSDGGDFGKFKNNERIHPDLRKGYLDGVKRLARHTLEHGQQPSEYLSARLGIHPEVVQKENTTPTGWWHHAAWPDGPNAGIHKSPHEIHFRIGVPASNYGPSGIVATKNDIPQGHRSHEYNSKMHENYQFFNLASEKGGDFARVGNSMALEPKVHADGDTIVYPKVTPRVVFYEPHPDKATWVRDMKSKGYHMIPSSKKLWRDNDKDVGFVKDIHYSDYADGIHRKAPTEQEFRRKVKDLSGNNEGLKP